MEKHELLAELKALRAELEKSEKIDPHALQRLSAITDELETRGEPVGHSEESDAHGLRDLLVRFEAEHPQLSETLGRIADGLARMGI